MKKVFLILLVLALPLIFAMPVFAVDVLDPVCSQPGPTGELPQICHDNLTNSTENPIIEIMKVALNAISLLAGIITVIMVILSGLKFIMAGGDANSISAARRSILFAIIGVAIIAFAQALVQFVLNKV